MLRTTFVAVALVLSLQTPGNSQEPARKGASLTSLAWMAGHWRGEAGGRVTEEVWMAPSGGLMVGMNRSVAAGRGASFESLRIVLKDGKATYLASPGGGAPTPFPLKSAGRNTVTFENALHDFPQRIIYKRDKNTMTARIEGTIQGKPRSMSWTWTLQQPGTPTPPAGLFKGLGTVVYRVKDLQKAKAWYADVLGMKPYFDQPFYVGFRVGGQEFGLDPDVKGVVRGNNQPAYWHVNDCRSAYKKLISKGARADSEPQDVGGGTVVATVIDPFGNTLGIIQQSDESDAGEER